MQINASIPNLIGGVSRQPELLRLPSHMKLQRNGFCSPARGLMKRPGTRAQGVVGGFGAGYVEMLDYGPRGVFWLHVNGGWTRLLRPDGSLVTLYDAAGNPSPAPWHAYLNAGATSLRAIKESDTTFLVNTDVVAQVAGYGADAGDVGALVWIKAGNYGRTYRVNLPGGLYAYYNTPNGSSPDHAAQTDTGFIAEFLAVQLRSLAGYENVYANGSIIHLPTVGAGVSVDDGGGGSSTALIYKTVRSIGDLPSSRAPNGFHVKVEGGDATGAGDYYLRFIAAENVWKEVRNPTSGYTAPETTTMPHMLYPYADGFKFQPIAWNHPLVGDGETNKNPSFIGRRINDVFFHQDRLGILSDEGYDFSETGVYFNFYRTTVTDLLDSDPVSGSITSMTKRSTLRHAAAFGTRLFLFSDTAQFELQSDPALTPKSAVTQRVADFECSSQVRPAALGSTLFFPVARGQHTAFYNMYLDGIDSSAQAADISSHVEEYIPKNVTKIAVSPVNNLMVALSADEPNALYVYQFYMNGAERLQSSWHKWDFADGTIIRGIGIVGTTLRMAVERSTYEGMHMCFEDMDLNATPTAYRVDRSFGIGPGAISVIGTGALDRTSVLTLPYAATPGVYFAVVTSPGTKLKRGSIQRLTHAGGRTMTVRGDLTGCTLEVGLQYRHIGTIGRLLVREQAGKGSAGISRGRTQVTRAWINFTDTAAFEVHVAKEGYETVVYKCSTKTLGTSSATIGSPALRDGRFSVPVMSRNTSCEISLVNDTPMPSTFLSIDWEGYHVSRGQHV